MPRSTAEQRLKARLRKAKSRARAREGLTRVELLVDVDLEDALREFGALRGEAGRSEIADAVALLLRSRLGLPAADVTRDPRRRGGR